MLSYTARKWLFIIAVFSTICMVTVLIPQLTMHNTSYETIEIITFQARIEWLHITIVILYTCALISTSAKYIHWYFIPLAVFITIQLVYYTWLLLDRDTYIQEQLELAWETTYHGDHNALNDIQGHWKCQGFYSLLDRAAYASDTVMRPCFPVLAKKLGTTIFVWGIGLWVIKLIQAIGLLACYALYIHISDTLDSNEPLLQEPDDLLIILCNENTDFMFETSYPICFAK
ncbi:hypothetical protein MFLAVUS_001594 [Mucor flavus]|uniref:Tetraspanin n=1 Tax=Mucor flavus TaxID=439312 RepID=A0ABP9YMY7_9FUNG